MYPTEIIIRKPTNRRLEYYRTYNLPSKEYPYYCIGYNEKTEKLYIGFFGVDYLHIFKGGKIEYMRRANNDQNSFCRKQECS
jgi:hypothetical protein